MISNTSFRNFFKRIIQSRLIQTLLIFALAVLLISVIFLMEGNKDFSLADEGFLWYGVQRVMLGELPIRDFQSYDPGRYYYSAMIMNALGGNSIMALRIAIATFQAIGLFIGLLLIGNALKKQNISYILFSAFILIAWMIPRHKIFDISLSIMLIGVLSYLVTRPINRRYFLVGICVGLAAIFGRNHGIYALISSVGVVSYVHIKSEGGPRFIEGLQFLALGILLGFSPMLLMFMLVPGAMSAFIESVRFLFELGSTNIPLPIPWPWQVNFYSLPLGEAIRGLLVGIFFILLVVFGVISIVLVIWQRAHQKKVFPVFVAAAFLALPYAHFAYSRADTAHLAQGIFPMLIGFLVLMANLSARYKWPLAIILFLTSLSVCILSHPGWRCYLSKQCVNIEVSSNTLLVDPMVSRDVVLLRSLSDQLLDADETFMTAPFWPGAYALLKRKSPTLEIYPISPRSRNFQEEEIERLKKSQPKFVFIIDRGVDGRDELRYENSHPLIYQYILDNFELHSDITHPTYKIYKAKN